MASRNETMRLDEQEFSSGQEDEMIFAKNTLPHFQ